MGLLRKIGLFYYEGFRSMTIGRTLWALILVKLAIMFLILKIFFFPDMFRGMDDRQKADYVSRELINR